MTNREQPSVDELLAALRSVPSDGQAYVDSATRVQARLAISTAPLAVLGTPPAASSPPAAVSPLSPLPAASLAPRVASASKAVVLAWLVPVFAAGVVTGLGTAHFRAQNPPVNERVPWVAPRASVVPNAVTEPVLELEAPRSNDSPPTPAPRTKVPSAASSGTASSGTASSSAASSSELGSSLAAEQRLLDTARTSLAHGEAEAALLPLEQHATHFPNGALAEEREALSVRVLAALGRNAEAAARATRFMRRFPNSLFAPVVRSTLESISGRNGAPEPKP